LRKLLAMFLLLFILPFALAPDLDEINKIIGDNQSKTRHRTAGYWYGTGMPDQSAPPVYLTCVLVYAVDK